jgi:steroid delta-isomerase-like uncharacterized protein
MMNASVDTRPQSPVALAPHLIDLLDRHDLDRVEAYWHDDVVEDILPVGVFRGKSDARRFFAETFAAFPDFHIVTEKVVGDDTTAFISWRVTGTFNGGSFQGIEPTGAKVEIRGTDRMEFANGKLVRNTVYYDGMGFARAIGMMPPAGSIAEIGMKGAFNALSGVKRALGL